MITQIIGFGFQLFLMRECMNARMHECLLDGVDTII